MGAVGPEPRDIEGAVRHIYDWLNGRSVAAMQLTFGPIVAAAASIVVKPDSTLVLVVGGVVVSLSVALGVIQLFALNWLHGEYAYAVRLACELGSLHHKLAAFPDGTRAPGGSAAGYLYDEHIGSISMVEYRDKEACREQVLKALQSARDAKF